MQYRKFGSTGTEISALGFGAMRLPMKNETEVDEEEAIRVLRYAIDHGVNYIDTAYMYHDGKSELIVGRALKDGYREKTYLATKMPTPNVEKEEDFDRILEEQLAKLQVETIDFYLLHALNRDRWENIVLKFNLLAKLEQAKAAGKINHIGFSFHDDLDAFKMIVDGYDKWEFCQIQYNYVDTDRQAGTQGLEYAAAKGLGVIIMEPLRGGKLAVPPVQVAKALSKKKSPVEWALNFLWSKPEVSFLLSGMSNAGQLEENLKLADKAAAGMLKGMDLVMLKQAKKVFDTMALVPCTQCGYCMPCPVGLDIPKIYESYNMTVSAGMPAAKKRYFELELQADACVHCGKCEKICPQGIFSTHMMPEIAEAFSEKK